MYKVTPSNIQHQTIDYAISQAICDVHLLYKEAKIYTNNKITQIKRKNIQRFPIVIKKFKNSEKSSLLLQKEHL